MSTHSLDKSGRYFAVIDPSSTDLKVITTQDSKTVQTIKCNQSKFTCLAWYSSTIEQGGENIAYLAIGQWNGKVLVYDIVSGNFLCKIEEHSLRIVDLTFGSSKNDLFSCDIDGKIVRWDIAAQSCVEKATSEDGKSLVRMASSDNGAILATSSSSIRLWDIPTMSTLRKHKGASGQSLYLLNVASNTSRSSKPCIVAGARDRYLTLYEADSGSHHTKSTLQSIQTTANIQSISTYTYGTGAATVYIVAAVTDQKVIELFKLNSTKQLEHTTVKLEGFTVADVISICVINEFDLIVSYGDITLMGFEKIKYVQGDQLSKSLVITKKSAREITNKPKPSTKQAKQAVVTSGNAIILDDQKGQLPAIDPKEKKASSRNAGTVCDLVIQGLTSSDEHLLSRALTCKMDVVENTVRSLPSPYAFGFLKHIITALATDLKNTHIVIMWVNLIIKYHSSYLMTVPNLKNQLSLLNSVIEDKFKLYDTLIRVVGKFELVEGGKYRKTGSTVDYTPAVVYNDNSDEEDDDDDDEFDEDDESEELDDIMKEDDFDIDSDLEVDSDDIGDDDDDDLMMGDN